MPVWTGLLSGFVWVDRSTSLLNAFHELMKVCQQKFKGWWIFRFFFLVLGNDNASITNLGCLTEKLNGAHPTPSITREKYNTRHSVSSPSVSLKSSSFCVMEPMIYVIIHSIHKHLDNRGWLWPHLCKQANYRHPRPFKAMYLLFATCFLQWYPLLYSTSSQTQTFTVHMSSTALGKIIREVFSFVLTFFSFFVPSLHVSQRMWF